MRDSLVALVLACVLGCGCGQGPEKSGVMVIGAGIAGLSAALEAADTGATVRVVDMWSVYGGHAVMSNGAVCIVDTPVQQQQGLNDSADIAYRDFTEWGEDADEQWVRYYTENSRKEIYDWLTPMGVDFYLAIPHDGNSVPRLHFTWGKGLALVSAIYRRCLDQPRISFEWNTRIDGLISEAGRVVGASGRNLRTSENVEYRAGVVIVATGGFESNLELVRKHWPADIPVPPRIVLGSGINARGSGLNIARGAGAAIERMDHQWIYALGLPDPRDESGERGLSVFIPDSVWINAEGKRFVNEIAGAKTTLFEGVARQPGATYWAVFDDSGKASLKINRPGWNDAMIERMILQNDNLTQTAASLDDLALKIGVPPQALRESVQRFNGFVHAGTDRDFSRFTSGSGQKPQSINDPPFYAVQFYPVSRKSMGGIRVDRECRVLDTQENPIPGLFAAGEVTGFGGINGKAALEGTFLGPSIVMGRVAARAAAAEEAVQLLSGQHSANDARAESAPERGSPRSCRECHNLATDTVGHRPGFEHFRASHRVVASQGLDCQKCHRKLYPYRSGSHSIDPRALVESCANCHAQN